MAPDHSQSDLSRRERQIMDSVHRRAGATVSDVLADLPDPPSYSAIRTTMGILVDKGWLKRRKDGKRFVYEPTESPSRARRSALDRVVRTFFEGDPSRAAAALLDMNTRSLSPDDLERLQGLIDRARKEGR